jgi:hypothetical protein
MPRSVKHLRDLFFFYVTPSAVLCQCDSLIFDAGVNRLALSYRVFPGAVELHWEIENGFVWNEYERANERLELVYEISWIVELGA